VVSKIAHPLTDISQIFDNRILIVALVACVFAQVLKLAIELIVNGKLSVKILTTTGGMPSAHSALVRAWLRLLGKRLVGVVSNLRSRQCLR
jgi:uncharacterized protein